MRALGKCLLQSNIHAIGVIASLTLASLLLSPAAYILSGTPLGLVTLRKGSHAGLQVGIGVSLLLALIAAIVKLPIQIVLVYMFFIWLPVWFCASILRWKEQQGALVFAAGLLATVILAALYLALGDIDATVWQDWLRALFIEKFLPEEKQAEYETLLAPMAASIKRFLAIGLMLNIVTTVLLSRWWQAALFNPNGFKKEFYQLKLPAGVLPFVALGALAASGLAAPWNLFAIDALIIIALMFSFQGLSFVHRTAVAWDLSRFWLTLLYVFLLFFPQIIFLLACAGIVDGLLTSRK